jgi:hypothetical protein
MRNNPWQQMSRLVQRRVDSRTPHNLYWVTDSQGGYGLLIQVEDSVKIRERHIDLRGIRIFKDDSKKGITDLYLILQNNQDWEVFLSLCEDLIKVILECSEGAEMIIAVEQRLKRWQQLLQHDRRIPFSIARQMGLFAELCCLKEVVAPKYGICQAINSWNGPESDKQDFLLDDAVLEVKSYRTSKGDAVSISSLKQLYSEKNLIYLMTYALTSSENGVSIENLANEIRLSLNEQGNTADMDSFEAKLISYGYAPELIKEGLNSFIVDKHRIFHVTEEFPKITPMNVTDSIVSVTYSIDLTKCKNFEVSLETF